MDNTDDDEAAQENANGYEPLPTSNEGLEDNDGDQQEEDEIEFGYTTFNGEEFHTRTSRDFHQLLDVETASREEQAMASSTELPPSQAIPLDTTQIESIKSIMSNFSLPTAAIPEWAGSVSDDQLVQAVEKKFTKKTEENWAVFD